MPALERCAEGLDAPHMRCYPPVRRYHARPKLARVLVNLARVLVNLARVLVIRIHRGG